MTGEGVAAAAAIAVGSGGMAVRALADGRPAEFGPSLDGARPPAAEARDVGAPAAGKPLRPRRRQRRGGSSNRSASMLVPLSCRRCPAGES